LDPRITSTPTELQTKLSLGWAIPALQRLNKDMLAVFAQHFQKCEHTATSQIACGTACLADFIF
jgi:hypothetical protein